MPIGSTLIFDTVETNIGNGYSKTTGIFTAPASGLYAFTWTVHAADRFLVLPKKTSEYGEINAALMQNGAVKGVIVADTEREWEIRVLDWICCVGNQGRGSNPDSCY